MKGEIKLEGLSELSGKSLEEALQVSMTGYNIDLTNTNQNSFSKEECPIWMDSSTTEFVDKFDREIPVCSIDISPPPNRILQNLNGITGSRAYHRFSGMQIAKIFKYEREVYDSTSVRWEPSFLLYNDPTEDLTYLIIPCFSLHWKNCSYRFIRWMRHESTRHAGTSTISFLSYRTLPVSRLVSPLSLTRSRFTRWPIDLWSSFQTW